MEKTKYDVFISYRRDGGEQKARIIQQALIARGYNVFLDFDELRDGKFNEALNTAIAETPIFLLLLTRGSLERCVNEGDWVRREIEIAIETERHIIPVNPDSEFDGKFPKELPFELLKYIGQHQFSDVMFKSLFNESIDKMVRDRIRPVLKNEDKNGICESVEQINSNTSAIHFETDMACAVLRFKSLECVLKVGEDKVLYLTKGHHKFTFQSTDNANDKYDIVFEVKEAGIEDFIDIQLVPCKIERLREESIDRKRRKPQGDWFLGEFYEFSYDNDYDKRVVDILLKNEDTLSAEDSFELGVHYELGWGIAQNLERAFACFCKSAEKGYARAEAAVGLHYANGEGVKEDPHKAFMCFSKAEEKSLPFAYYFLGQCYKNAIGVEKNDKKAFEYFQIASFQGIASSTYEMAECYLKGEGVQTNEKKAFELYDQILLQEERADALTRKGECYLYGWGVEQNNQESYNCFNIASESDFSWALYRLAECFEKGYGTERDELKSILTYIKANYYGSAEAQERLEKELTPSNIKKLISDVSSAANALSEKIEKNEYMDIDEKTKSVKEMMIFYEFLANNTGDPESQIKLAECYEQGIGTEIDYQKANDVWRKLIDKGSARAYRELGINLAVGNGSQNINLGIEYLQHAVEEGDTEAMLLLGRIYQDETLGIISPDKALYYMQMSAGKGNAEAQWRLAEWYYNNEQFEMAFVWATKSAIQQNDIGRYDYGRFLFNGLGCEQDIELGLSILTAVANEGYDHAQWYLGEIYRNGRYVEENITEAAKWYEMAAEQGHIGGMFQYAFIYWNGVGGVIENEKKALEYFKRVAETGDARSEFCIGDFYENGRGGVRQDFVEACRHYEISAELGDDLGLMAYARFIDNGLGGCEIDEPKAFRMYLQAAEMGNSEAQAQAGRCLLFGTGVKKNLSKAEELLKQSAENGDSVGQFIYGVLLQQTRRNAEAVEMYEKAAEQDVELAIVHLADAYMYGKLGLQRNYDKMRYWIEAGVKNESPMSYCMLGFCQEYGRGYSKSLVDAMRCYEKSLQGGCEEAAFNLGRFYENGFVVEKDINKAIELYQEAIRLSGGDHKAAAKRINRLVSVGEYN